MVHSAVTWGDPRAAEVNVDDLETGSNDVLPRDRWAKATTTRAGGRAGAGRVLGCRE